MSACDDYMAEMEAKSLEVTDASQGRHPMYASVNPVQHSWSMMEDSAAASRSLPRSDGPHENGNPSPSGYHYHYNQKNEMVVSREAPGATIHESGSFGATTQDYANYTSYPYSSDTYSSNNPEYQRHYYAHQQQPANISHQQLGSGQNTGAYYQPLSSFQNPSSYVGPTSYNGTYFSHGDYQTTSGYTSSGYASQTNVWNSANPGTYPAYEYPKYTVPSTSSTHNANTATEAPLPYQQQYSQWAAYYTQNMPNVLHAPESENKQLANESTGSLPQSSCGGYSYGYNQPPPPGTTSWRLDFSSSKLPCIQGNNEVTECNRTESAIEARHLHYEGNSAPAKGPNVQFPLNNQVFQNFQSPSQTVSCVDARQASKVQIPTNPRIAPIVTVNVMKTDKEVDSTNVVMKPAYVNVSAPKPSNQVPSQDSPGSIPPSLRRYVEKTFARCKNDLQRAANQTIMKDMITNASADGTLLTRDWDTESVFALPGMDDTVGKKSPSKRTKSRWEPVPEPNAEKSHPFNGVSGKFTWNNIKSASSPQSKGPSLGGKETWTTVKFVPSEQKTMSTVSSQRPLKKQRHGDNNAVLSSDASSDSDKEQNLSAHRPFAVSNSPEERKKRENRFKRFEKRGDHQSDVKQLQMKDFGAENLYARRIGALLLAKKDDTINKAVEDIDWDSLTLKGTCQEIEKRYLRLTSAPDPATVRPEEVLEKALLMVQNSSKNYLYKCDQLKSIRQDLTVQRIRNELTVKVYETHARIALEAGDLSEYNQCQSQLKTLYAEGIKGCRLEFSAYNLLCLILHSNNREVLSSMARLSVEAKEDDAVKHALAVRASVTSGNYILFFRLYREAPNLNTCLMDLYAEKMRFAAVNCMCKSYRPTVPIAYISQVLGFSKVVVDEEADGLDECENWLKSHGASLTFGSNGEKLLDTKVSSANLFMPDPEDAVAHGDASLAVDDFLTKVP